MSWFSKLSVTSVFDKAKRKKRIVLVVLCGAVGIVTLLASVLRAHPVERTLQPVHHRIEVKADTKAYDVWQAKEGSRIDRLTQTVKSVKSESTSRHQQVARLERNVDQLHQQVLSSTGQLAVLKAQNQLLSRQLFLAKQHRARESAFKTSLVDHGLPPEPNEHVQRISSVTPPAQLLVSGPPPEQTRRHTTYPIKWQRNPYQGLLPQGSFMQATLLTGVDAGAGSFTYHNPVPVTLRITNNAMLPAMDNQVIRYHTKGCHVIATAYGSASEERVMIKTTRITCISADGQHVMSAPFQASATDSDGHIGLRGKLISRQGSKLMKAFFAGFASNLGNSLSSAQGITTTSLVGPVRSLSPTQAVKSGLYGGAGQSGQELSQFLLQQAQSIYPVIVVNAGRNVTLTTFGFDSHLQWHSESRAFVPEPTAHQHVMPEHISANGLPGSNGSSAHASGALEKAIHDDQASVHNATQLVNQMMLRGEKHAST